ncbi:MAG: ATP-dependent helicase [Candidatus Paceibacterota bacterium]
MHEDLFKELNKQQREAVAYTAGPSIILAGAGSGKTRVIVYKVLHLIQDKGFDPSSIVMVTFTNKAAGEMKYRVGKPLGFTGTFHSFCVSILRRHGDRVGLGHNFLIYDEHDKETLLKDILKNVQYEKNLKPYSVGSRISSAKDNLITYRQYKKYVRSEYDEAILQVYTQYQKILEKNNAADFDDLIAKTVKLFTEHPRLLSRYEDVFRYLLVDEFHDTNFAQYTLSRLLAKRNQNITVVGDFSQSIYSWRGADLKNLEKFQSDFPSAKVFHLVQNYRSTQNILDFAYRVIKKNETHPILELFTDNTQGERVEVTEAANEQEEAIRVVDEIQRRVVDEGYETCAVLYRVNAQSRVIEEALLHYSIPYVLVGGVRFYKRREIKDIVCYMRLLVNETDEVSLKRAIKLGKRRFAAFKKYHKSVEGRLDNKESDELIGEILEATGYLELFDEHDEADLARLENIKELRSVAQQFPKLNDFLEQIALVESEYSQSEKDSKGKKGVNLMTLHACKGLEFPYVFITGVEEGLLPHSRSQYDQHELEEERRLFYVGITRAKKKLYISHARRRFLFGRRVPAEVSRFLSNEDGETYYAKTF